MANEPSDFAPTEELGAIDDRAPKGCVLYVALGEAGSSGRSLRLTGGEAIVGSDPGCDLILRDASVSRRHLRLVIDEGGILVEDLGSTNGTTYLGQRLERAYLKPGARLGVGRCRLDVLPLAESASTPLSTRTSYGDLIGTTPPMRRLYAMLGMLENSDAPALIEGETGTGKELVARALHAHGLRANKPFVVLDCGTIPVELVESQLFGHRKGAFTDAARDQVGAFESANGGTVFLDEIGELPLSAQPKLLRVLETGEVKRVGDSAYKPVDVRVIAATKRQLTDEVARGRFREDLFYRLAVVRLTLPPLRDRRDDIPLLAQHLAQRVSKGSCEQLPSETLDFLVSHDWPGNVRELRNVVQRILALGDVELFAESSGAAANPGANGELVDFRRARDRALREFEHRYLVHLMERCGSESLSAAAREAGIDRRQLRDLLKKHGLYRATE